MGHRADGLPRRREADRMTLVETKTGPLRGPLRKRESNLWQREAHDWYCEPAWCSARLFAAERFEGRVYDPACGGGTIVKSALDAGLVAYGSDLINRGWDSTRTPHNFLETPATERHDNIVSNPPFGIAERFVSHALQLAERRVAMLLPANWVQGDKRSRWLAETPLRRVLFITPRPSMPPGQVLAAGGKPGNGTTDYAFFIWLRGYDGRPELGWLRRDP
jgi:hypothetical protein